jgi:hypothetical protein
MIRDPRAQKPGFTSSNHTKKKKKTETTERGKKKKTKTKTQILDFQTNKTISLQKLNLCIPHIQAQIREQ